MIATVFITSVLIRLLVWLRLFAVVGIAVNVFRIGRQRLKGKRRGLLEDREKELERKEASLER